MAVEPVKLFVCITDDEWGLLPHFLRHYASSGVRQFYIACSADFEATVKRYRADFDITTVAGLDVLESIPGGVTAVTELRRRHQKPREWVVVVDLDEFVKLDEPLSDILCNLEEEGATVARGIMLDRFAGDGQLRSFTESDDLSKVFPVASRLCQQVMKGPECKGVFVKGHLRSALGHHFFVDERVATRQFEIAHYRFHGPSLDRLRNNLARVHASGETWGHLYENIIRHYDQNQGFAWETFGGWRDDLLRTDCGLDGKVIPVWHRDNLPDRAVMSQLFTHRRYDLPGCVISAVAAYHSRIASSGQSALVVDAGANIGASALWFGFKWPPCRVVGIEPDRDNYEIMTSNLNRAHLDRSVYHAAIDYEAGMGIVVDVGGGEWAYQVHREGVGQSVRTITLGQVLSENRGYVPFILKIDIEGGEQELFNGDTTAMDEFPIVVIGLHDWMMPQRKSSVPFFRWHATRNRLFVSHGDIVLSVDWDKLMGDGV